MQISSNYNDIKTHNFTKPGSYEWWYFDFMDENSGYSFVVIFFTSFLFSPRYIKKSLSENNFNINDHCAINVCVYRDNKPIDYLLVEYDRHDLKFTESENEYSINIAQNQITYVTTDEGIKVYLNCNVIDPSSGKKIKIKCEYIPVVNNLENKILNSETDFPDKWLPIFPKCKVSGKMYLDKSSKSQRSVKKVNIEGTGYNDKNWSDKPVYKDIDDWIWGRCHIREYTVILFKILYSQKTFSKFLIYKNDKLISDVNDAEFISDFKKNYWRLQYPSLLNIKSGENVLTVNNNNLIDNGPFYIRFISDFNLKINSETLNGKGIFEIIKPQRLLSKFLHPFINLRIKTKD